MQAHLYGKKIQYRSKTNAGKWIDHPNPEWNWEDCEYRIKRKPRTIWVNEYPAGLSDSHYNSKELADRGHALTRIACRKFVEVLEDGE
jgi:hypothetical protein